MKTKNDIPNELLSQLEAEHIDIDLTLSILNKYNNGDYAHIKPVHVTEIPGIDGKQILDCRNNFSVTFPKETVIKSLEKLKIDISSIPIPRETDGQIIFTLTDLEKAGILLSDKTAYGVLNGGSASSYIDHKKNQSLNKELYELYSEEFRVLEKLSTDKPKGITPAFLQPDGTPGPSYMELKLRALCIQSLSAQKADKTKQVSPIPFFQMTSLLSDEPIKKEIETYNENPLLSELMKETGFSRQNIHTAIQPLLAAFTHSSAGEKKDIFSTAFGKENTPRPMPGGHGQNFMVLKDIYQKLYNQGIRFAYIGNIDNLGNTIDPAAVGLLAVSGADAGFDFSFRTSIDVKGGVLILDSDNKINAADIGPAISFDEIKKAEDSGKHILFNCATGLFNLEYLTKNIDKIINELPVRISDQNKDAGKYSQAEQITWEVIGLIPHPLIFGVDKYNRFLAVKILLEGLLTSGCKLDDPAFPKTEEAAKLRTLGKQLNKGLTEKLSTVYGMKLKNNRWIPKTVGELKAEIA